MYNGLDDITNSSSIVFCSKNEFTFLCLWFLNDWFGPSLCALKPVPDSSLSDPCPFEQGSILEVHQPRTLTTDIRHFSPMNDFLFPCYPYLPPKFFCAAFVPPFPPSYQKHGIASRWSTPCLPYPQSFSPHVRWPKRRHAQVGTSVRRDSRQWNPTQTLCASTGDTYSLGFSSSDDPTGQIMRGGKGLYPSPW